MNEAFVCPQCGGPLTDTGGSSVTCPFCNSVIIPKDLKTRPLRPTSVQIPIQTQSQLSQPSASKIVLPVIAGVAAVALAGVILVVVLVSRRSSINSPGGRPIVSSPLNPSTPGKSGFASIALQFGSKGIGPGMFDDSRAIAVDGTGNIYVGDYSGGRIQVFDSSGTFIRQWMADTTMPLQGMAADRQGKVYVVQKGLIYRYDGATGITSDHLQTSGNRFNGVVAAPDGGLVTVTNGTSDDIIRYDMAGKATMTVKKAISGQTNSSELDSHVAVDGLGNIYVLGTFNCAVFKFNRDGKFQNEFGGRGRENGQFTAPESIAVDGQGRIYVSDFSGIQVFDPNGRYLATIKPGCIAFGMVFNDKNELIVAGRDRVVKLTINKL